MRTRVKCPNCGAPLPLRIVQLDSPFACPSCRARLSIRRSYSTRQVVAGAALGIVAVWLAGVQDPFTFVLAWVAASVVATFLVSLVSIWFLPPEPVIFAGGLDGRLTVLPLEPPSCHGHEDAADEGPGRTPRDR